MKNIKSECLAETALQLGLLCFYYREQVWVALGYRLGWPEDTNRRKRDRNFPQWSSTKWIQWLYCLSVWRVTFNFLCYAQKYCWWAGCLRFRWELYHHSLQAFGPFVPGKRFFVANKERDASVITSFLMSLIYNLCNAQQVSKFLRIVCTKTDWEVRFRVKWG